MIQTKLINGYPFMLFEEQYLTEDESLGNSENFKNLMVRRRSIRHFSARPVSEKIIKNIITVANSAPSGANKQPWTFCLIRDENIKKEIREMAEHEEKLSYNQRMPPEWLEDLAPLQTNWEKHFLEKAPYLIVVFKKLYELHPGGTKQKYYYVSESTGIATGFLIAAIHNAGLVTLTHTPSPMNFLSKILNRPENEKPFLLLPVGYPAAECWVPDIKKKAVEEVTFYY